MDRDFCGNWAARQFMASLSKAKSDRSLPPKIFRPESDQPKLLDEKQKPLKL